MNKVFLCRLFVSALGLLSVLAWTNPVETDFTNSHLDEQEAIIRERIPTVVTIVSPIYNPAVRSYLNTYIYRRPEQTSNMLGWAAYYFPKFEKALQEEGMPTDLKYLAIVESALNPNAISRSGAGGLWQFMKPTARECGLKCGTYVDERMDPEKSTKAAVHYLKTLYRMFGNWELVMAAYNAGPGRVRSAVKRAGTTDYWKVAKYLPQETQSYVPGFIAASYLYNFHTEHNIVANYPEYAMGDLMPVVIHEGMSLPELAKRSGLTFEIVKSLNPSFFRNYVPTSTAGYTIWLPAVSAELFNTNRILVVPALPMEVTGETEKIEAADVKTVTVNGKLYNIRNTTKKYTVRSGDNLYTIASRNDCTVKELMSWNRLRSTKLAIGQRLEIRKEVKELVPVIVETVPAQAVRNELTIAGVPTLALSSLTCKTTDEGIIICTQPVVREQSDNSIVLKRRQSLRQALGSSQHSASYNSSQIIMPNTAFTGDVVRLKTRA